jgi:hypothetical protein
LERRAPRTHNGIRLEIDHWIACRHRRRSTADMPRTNAVSVQPIHNVEEPACRTMARRACNMWRRSIPR